MQITNFSPLILTKNAKEIIDLFEALGFESCHKKTNIGDADITSVVMRYTGEDDKDFHVAVIQCPVERDSVSIRMNVRDIDEVYRMLGDKGFVNPDGSRVTNTGTSKAAMMVSPSGFSISLSEHIKG